MPDRSLLDIYRAHGGKVSDKWQLYLSEYDSRLSGRRGEPVRLLEIGVQNGGSLEIWSKYFPAAEVIAGCDIDPECAGLEFSDPRISVVVGDIGLPDTEERVLGISDEFDIIIDDGSHRSADIIRSFSRYFRHVADNGLYVVEDLHCGYWQEFGGGLFDPMSSISFLKALADIVNHPNWGLDRAREDILRGFVSKYGLDSTGEGLSQIHSIEFLNSMCIVRKTRHNANLLGNRIIAGCEEQVAPGHLEISTDRDLIVPAQGSNFWSNRELPPAEELPDRLRELADQEMRLGEMSRQMLALDEHLLEVNQKAEDLAVRLAESGKQLEQRNQRISGLERQLDERGDQLRNLKQELAGQKEKLFSLREQAEERDQALVRADQQIAALGSLHNHVRSTLSWRLTAPFRSLGSRRGFNKKYYLEQNPDVAENGMDPFDHFVAYGLREGREPRPQTRMDGYRANIRNIRRTVAGQGGLFRSAGFLLAVARHEGLAGLRQRIDMAMGWEGVEGYADWVKAHDTLDDEDRQRIRRRIESMSAHPLISIVMPAYNTQTEWLKEAIDSVRNQLYENWELCIADDASTDPNVLEVLQQAAAGDQRIKLVLREENGHISMASNSALELCEGEWVALLDHDDRLAEHALFCVADVIDRQPTVQLIYSDEDKFDESGQRSDPYFKCDWNPDLFYSHNMISHLGVYHKAVLQQIGGFRKGFEGSQDYDLALRFIEKIEPKNIFHIPRVLYHWRVHPGSTARGMLAKPYAQTAAEKALQQHFDRCGVAASVESMPHGYRVRYALPSPPPLVSLIIPTRNGLQLVKTCVESILERTNYADYEILIVDNNSDDPETLEYFSKLDRQANIRILRDRRRFNFSMLNNSAVGEAKGEVIGFINNDIEVIAADWLGDLVSLALQPGVAAAGAKLLYPDDTVQHAGVVLGVGGIGNHAFLGKPASAPGYFNRARLISSFSALTAACMVVRKVVFLEVGGFDEKNLAVAFNDVDFCLRARELGYRNVLDPNALLYHHESATRGADNTPEKQARFDAEIQYMEERWGPLLRCDPAYNPNLTLHAEDFSLAWPPRLEPLASGA